MSVETWFRIIFAIIALGMAIYLAVALVTGHVRVGGRSVDRPAAPRLYWGAIGKTAILMTGLAIAAIQSSEDQRLPIAFASVIGGQLFEMLVSGVVAMPKGAYSKAERPGPYWRWVAFHAVVLALLIGLVVAQRTHFIIL
jgi:hypothetical protein